MTIHVEFCLLCVLRSLKIHCGGKSIGHKTNLPDHQVVCVCVCVCVCVVVHRQCALISNTVRHVYH